MLPVARGVMASSYSLAYVVLLWAIAFTVKVLDGRTGDVNDQNGSTH
jgi:hypothetical protein